MAKKKDALTNEPRLMNDISPSMSISSAGGLLTFYPGSNPRGWIIIPSNAGTEQYAVWRGYIDLAGYEMEQLTFVVQAATVTENQAITSLTFGDSGIELLECFSKVRLSDNDLNNELYSETDIYSPGYMDSLQDMEQIIWCRHRRFYRNANWSPLNLQVAGSTNVWGEGQATAGNRLHLTRILKLPAEEALCEVPQASFNVVGTAISESDLPYMMRLRRDYELAQQ